MKFAIGILTLFIVAAAFLSCMSNSEDEVEEKPNIVLIVIDTLRADHLPFFGYNKNTVPFFSEISTHCLLFRNAYSTSSWTAPSSASIHTSLYPTQHGVITGMAATRTQQETNENLKLNVIPEEVDTIAEVMKNAGYHTYAITDNINICETQGFAQGFDRFANYSDATAEKVNDTLKEWEEEIKSKDKSFIYLHYNDPHWPYYEKHPWFDQEAESRDVAAYDSEINYVDSMIKEMFCLFGWHENTIVIITSDHGEEFFEHGLKGHGKTLYNEVIHVPLIIYMPGIGLDGRMVGANVSTMDILPTLRDCLDLPTSKQDQGSSLVPFFDKKYSKSNNRYLFSHLSRKRQRAGKDILKQAVIYRNWKYISSLVETEKLFDISYDPAEVRNILEASPETALAMRNALYDFHNSSRKYEPESLEIPLDEETIKKIEAFGYLK